MGCLHRRLVAAVGTPLPSCPMLLQQIPREKAVEWLVDRRGADVAPLLLAALTESGLLCPYGKGGGLVSLMYSSSDEERENEAEGAAANATSAAMGRRGRGRGSTAASAASVASDERSGSVLTPSLLPLYVPLGNASTSGIPENTASALRAHRFVQAGLRQLYRLLLTKGAVELQAVTKRREQHKSLLCETRRLSLSPRERAREKEAARGSRAEATERANGEGSTTTGKMDAIATHLSTEISVAAPLVTALSSSETRTALAVLAQSDAAVVAQMAGADCDARGSGSLAYAVPALAALRRQQALCWSLIGRARQSGASDPIELPEVCWTFHTIIHDDSDHEAARGRAARPPRTSGGVLHQLGGPPNRQLIGANPTLSLMLVPEGCPGRITACIPRHVDVRKSKCNERQYIAFAVEVALAGMAQTWTVYRRYSEFERLRAVLQKTFIPKGPPFPAKQLIGSPSHQFLIARRQKLEKWLQHVLQVVSPPGAENVRWMGNCPGVRVHYRLLHHFLTMSANSPPQDDWVWVEPHNNFRFRFPSRGVVERPPPDVLSQGLAAIEKNCSEQRSKYASEMIQAGLM